MLQKIRKSKITKPVALTVATLLLITTIDTPRLFALTGGPSQIERQSFQAIEDTEMVDLFTGDFNYNIPLLDVGGYPINIGYTSGITNDQQASCVGLGWNINPGAITRNMRGLPDDFKGDVLNDEVNTKASVTVGAFGGLDYEIAGKEIPFDKIKLKPKAKLGGTIALSYNNYTGVGIDLGASVSAKVAAEVKSSGNGVGLDQSLSIKLSSTDGLTVGPQTSLSVATTKKLDKDTKVQKEGTLSGALSYNSREGLKDVSFKSQFKQKLESKTIKQDKEKGITKADEDKAKYIYERKIKRSGTLHTFTQPAFRPTVTSNMYNINAALSIKLGQHVIGNQFSGEFGFNYTQQWQQSQKKSSEGYGYLYAHDENVGNKSVLDYFRGNDVDVAQYTPNIAYAHQTYDTYSVSGQGISGSFRPYRSDVGTVYDKQRENNSYGGGLNGIDFSAAQLFQAGVTVNVNHANSKSGQWVGSNAVTDVFEFEPERNGDLFEPVYFKAAGDATVESDPAFMAAFGGTEPARVDIGDLKANKKLEFNDGSKLAINKTSRNARARRSDVMSYYTAEEVIVKNGGNGETIPYYEYENFGTANETLVAKTMPRADGVTRKAHHLSEMQVLREDGLRYIYSIPTYNVSQKDVTFNIASPGNDAQVAETGLTSGWSDTDASVDNSKGLDHYYQSSSTPGYANAFLLTGIVSPDYVDRTNDGLTPDDLGTYTKFNYIKWKDNYKWRTPYNDASYNEGIKSDPVDDKASYVYGEKEIWYIHSIETRTHLAVFDYSARSDGYGVSKELNRTDAGTPLVLGDQLLKLDNISLYAKPALESNVNAAPIKTVHFEYDYSLCKGVNNSALPNNDGTSKHISYAKYDASGNLINPTNDMIGGKLTLRKLYFTYQNSFKGEYSPYNFNYCYEARNANGEMLNNYPYHIKAYDRWGNYKPVATNVSLDAETGTTSNGEFPYVSQTDTNIDLHAAAWTLTSIELPSGGRIEVDYESDDYAFVQDKQAMQMMKIVAATDNLNSDAVDANATDMLYDNSSGAADNKNILVFELQEPISASSTALADRYFKDLNGNTINDLYFRFLLNVDPFGFDIQHYSYVSAYAGIKSFGVFPGNGTQKYIENNDYKYGYVELENAEHGNLKAKINPISNAAWKYVKIHQPHLAYGGPAPEDATSVEGSVLGFFKALSALGIALAQAFTGYGNFMMLAGGGQEFVKEKSWIRTYNPILSKKGGGLRVKRLVINNRWKDQLANVMADRNLTNTYENEVYGQEYSYKVYNEITKTYISSGVASYEPGLGGDENPFRQPVPYTVRKILAPDTRYFQELPYCEEIFPGASVGYSHVEVTSINKDNVSKNRTGKMVADYYTARDFPTIVTKTDAKKIVKMPNAGLALLGFAESKLTASQGYTIELNNMHGAKKAEWIYAEDQDVPLAGTEYFYKSQAVSKNAKVLYSPSGDSTLVRTAGPQKLTNEIQTVATDGTISTETMGVDFEMTVDSRSSNTFAGNYDIEANIMTWLIGPFPIILPAVWPAISITESDFRSLSTLKTIHRSGILDKVVNHDLGSAVTTENLLYDKETSQILLTKTSNDFNDPVYDFTYPAYWAHEGMGPAYKNVKLKTTGNNLNSLKDHLSPGDELQISTGNSTTRAWVVKTAPSLEVRNDDDAQVNVATTRDKIIIIRSGYRNMTSNTMGHITSLESPIVGDRLIVADNPSTWKGSSFAASILDAGSVEFANEWKVFCDCNQSKLTNASNTYYTGRSGNWRPSRSFMYLTTRTQDIEKNSPFIREDGRFENFSPFWEQNNGNWSRERNAGTNWAWGEEITLFSQRGQELENRDRLLRRSSAIYRYSDLLPVSAAENAYHREIANDNFEDYSFDTQCHDDHFSFKSSDPEIVKSEAHTGESSLALDAGEELELLKPIQECEAKERRNPLFPFFPFKKRFK